jgi:periplasmic divalent cation tolerance protein
MSDIYVVYSTFPNRSEAISMARELLDKKLVACVNILDAVTSLYRWQNEVKEEAETLLLAKTAAAKLQAAMEHIKAAHSYQLPCIVAYRVSDGNPEFLRWVEGETAPTVT